MATEGIAKQIAEILFNKVATPIQIADAGKNLRDAFQPDSSLDGEMQQRVVLLNTTAGGAGVVSTATGYAEIY